MPGPIRALLFDVEGVIARPDQAAADRRLAALSAGLDSRAVHEARNRPRLYLLWETYSIGQLSRYAYWKAVVEALGLPPDPDHVVEMLDIQSATSWGRLDPAMLDLIASLEGPGRPRLGLLSNSAPDHERFIAGFESRFDVVQFSHRTGRRKPQPEAYLEAVAALAVEPEACLFIDDKLRNVEAAARLGLIAWHYADLDSFKSELQRVGLLGVPVGKPEPAHG